MQARAYDQLLSTYTGVPLSAGGDEAAAATPAARQQFDAGNGGILGFARSQINGVFGGPIGAWRVMSFIFDIVRLFAEFITVFVLCDAQKLPETVEYCTLMPFDSPFTSSSLSMHVTQSARVHVLPLCTWGVAPSKKNLC